MTTLKVENFQEKVNLPQKEHEVLSFWDETKAFEKSVETRPENRRYVFYDGPPFATGLPHYGHILASTIKDVIPRYWTMKGYRVDRVWGWDCHGIPIENMIEKELGLKGGKKGIEELGVGKFNAACRAAILRFDTEWEKVIRRIGRWVDFKDSYKTMDNSYMESVWWAFKTLYEKGLVYEGKKVILYCPRCATPLSNFEIAMDNSYKNLPGPSTIYKFKLKNQQNTYLLAWSTTPWNKLATPALAVNQSLEYVKVQQGNEFYILAKTTLEMLHKEPAYKIVETYVGKDLEQFEFELQYDFYPKRKPGERAGVVIADTYVTAAEGTGIVTLAVYGEDDYRVMTTHSVQLVYHIDEEGKLNEEVKPWAGMFILKVNPLVNADLAKRGLIYHDEERLHSVPVCYRCETRLYHAPVPAWFIDVQKMKTDLTKENEHINWYPEYLKYGRFGKGLESAPDWNISRSRYWGTPMPVWKCQMPNGQCQMRMIGSVEELTKWAVNPELVEGLTDLHREFLDDLEVWVDDARTVKGKRIPEVFDCWVESGSMPYASIHYPFKNKELFKKTHPGQFIAEYIAQTRAWFYTLHVMSVGLFGKHTFENAVTTGTILAEDGTKMSKSKKNYPDPSLLFEKYGVDALRFYLMSSVVMKGENVNFSEKQVQEIYQKVMSILWNTFSFYKLYLPDGEIVEKLAKQLVTNDLDKWIVSRTHSLIRDMTKSMEGYDTVASCRLIVSFVDNLSTWYLRRSRDRLKTDHNSMKIFGWVLKQVVLVLAPLAPFITELIYQNLTRPKGSVHLESWPEFDVTCIDKQLEAEMIIARKIVEQAHALRKLYALPIRQPLQRLEYDMPKRLRVGVEQLIAEEINVKLVSYLFTGTKLKIQEVTLDSNVEPKVKLDTKITRELEREGEIRQLIRKVQQLRKEKGCTIDAQIQLTLPNSLKATFNEAQLQEVREKTLSQKRDIIWGDMVDISIG